MSNLCLRLIMHRTIGLKGYIELSGKHIIGLTEYQTIKLTDKQTRVRGRFRIRVRGPI